MRSSIVNYYCVIIHARYTVLFIDKFKLIILLMRKATRDSNHISKTPSNKPQVSITNDYRDKKLEFKIFKPKLAHLSNIIDKKLFK